MNDAQFVTMWATPSGGFILYYPNCYKLIDCVGKPDYGGGQVATLEYHRLQYSFPNKVNKNIEKS